MAAILEPKPRPGAGWLEWLPVGAGLAALYGATFYDLSVSLWRVDDYAHGPVILGVIVWLLWRRRESLLRHGERAAPVAGLSLLAIALMLYVLGRSQEISVLEVGALAPILAGVLLAMRGWKGLRAFWFPIFFVIFLVPLPGVFIDSLTGPLKQLVSDVAERILYAADYPVARHGVVLTVGQYQLLVADACSGLNSMFSLTALGVLYLYVMERKKWLHSALILASTLPIAFAANVVRVLTLVLITYHFGDEAGQGFMHGSAGMVLVLVALVCIIALDALLARSLTPRTRA
jgi:exosortase B